MVSFRVTVCLGLGIGLGSGLGELGLGEMGQNRSEKSGFCPGIFHKNLAEPSYYNEKNLVTFSNLVKFSVATGNNTVALFLSTLDFSSCRCGAF